MSGEHATKQEIDEFFKHTKAHAANKVRLRRSPELRAHRAFAFARATGQLLRDEEDADSKLTCWDIFLVVRSTLASADLRRLPGQGEQASELEHR